MLPRRVEGETVVTFKIGQMAVYPAHGVGVVQAIESKSFSSGKKESFYVL
ncbi:MAG: CarD family transcriptional regulator, partial [Thermodesulfobacteriota bacterium]